VRNGRFVILGNGGAAISAATAARLSGHRGEILLISDTDELAFNPMLSPYYFKGEIAWQGCYPFGADVYRDHDVVPHFGRPVVALDARNRQVTLGDGGTLAYDRCLIATGAAPVIPAIPGLRESARVFALRNAASARKLEQPMAAARTAIILGVSLVGMKMAEILAKRGVQVILLGRGDQVLARAAHPSAAAILKRYFQDHGVDVRLGRTLEGLEDAGDRAFCRLSDGTVEAADIVLVCTGVRPNLDFVDRGQVEVDTAVVADECMRTSADGLYAAGDASQALNLITGRHEWRGTWGSACYQGRAAGQHMAGRDVHCAGAVSEHVSPFFDWTYAHIGDIQPQGGEVGHVACGDAEADGYALLAFQDGVITGANLINCTHLAGRLRVAILRKSRCTERWARGGGDFVAASAAVAVATLSHPHREYAI
jgi:3-phenylpropionate/trans-cinnamate dioxygenase ferredoxin reductase subunit